MKNFNCTNEKCDGVKLDHYMNVKHTDGSNDAKNDELMICPKCNTLYYISKNKPTHEKITDVMNVFTYKIFQIKLEDESFLISNIDSPANNSIECECGGKLCRASKFDFNNSAWFVCPDCHKILYKKYNHKY